MSEDLSREEIHRRVRERAGRPAVPGPSENPATNLLLADVAMRVGSLVLRRGVEKLFLSPRYGAQAASRIVDKRPLWHTLGASALARLATSSVPGAAVVGTAIVGKLLYDRSRSRRENRQAGDAALLAQAGEQPAQPGT